MEEIKLKGIVIKSDDYKDSDKLVTIFSAEKGLIRARARGVKKNKAKLAFAVQPFAFIEFMLTERDGFYTIINASSIDQFFDITSDFDNYIFMLACLEVVQKTVKENENQVDLFLLLLNSLKLVAYEKVSSINVFIKFMIEAMSVLGFSFVFDKCACCDNKINENNVGFSYDYNGLLCPKCMSNFEYLELNKVEYLILKNLSQVEISRISTLHFPSRENKISVVTLLLKVFRLLTEEEILTIKQFLWFSIIYFWKDFNIFLLKFFFWIYILL